LRKAEAKDSEHLWLFYRIDMEEFYCGEYVFLKRKSPCFMEERDY
jgi:hypothetical protein